MREFTVEELEVAECVEKAYEIAFPTLVAGGA